MVLCHACIVSRTYYVISLAKHSATLLRSMSANNVHVLGPLASQLLGCTTVASISGCVSVPNIHYTYAFAVTANGLKT